MSEKQINEVNEFIKRRFSKDCDWTNGNCYWFAAILTARFPYLSIYYLPITGHFVAGALNTYFDWRGCVQIDEPVQLFEEIMKNERQWGRRIVRDCIL